MFGQTAEQMLALMLIAQAEGRHPAIVARDYYVIQGRPTLKADAMLARFQEVGGRVQWHKLTETEAEATISHPLGGEVRLSWTLEMAKKANLIRPGPWQQFPRAMLRARLISEGIRTVYPAVVCGVYTPEEAVDIPPTVVENEARVIEVNADQNDIDAIQNYISNSGLDIERVLNWTKTAWGVESFDKLTATQAQRLLDKLAIWAKKE
jgi:hypothetical protein